MGGVLMDQFYIVFEDTTMWYGKFLKKGFGHCSVFKKVSDDKYIFIDPFTSYVGVYLVNPELLHHKLLTANVLYLEKDLTNLKRKSKLIVPLTCVSVVCEVLGVEKSTYTPFQLYQHLLLNGAVSTLIN